MKIIGLLLSVTLLTATFAIVSCGEGGLGGSASPSDVVQIQMGSIADGDYDTAVSIYVNKNGEELTEEEQLKLKAFLPEAKKEMDKKGGLQEVIILEENISADGSSATVDYQLLYGNGEKSDSDTAKLLLVDGTWRGNAGW